MLQKNFRIFETTVDENFIVNDFDKPYIAIVFSSLHLMDTASNSLIRSMSILSHLVLSLFSVFTFSVGTSFEIL